LRIISTNNRKMEVKRKRIQEIAVRVSERNREKDLEERRGKRKRDIVNWLMYIETEMTGMSGEEDTKLITQLMELSLEDLHKRV
jgi:hypothetical protein